MLYWYTGQPGHGKTLNALASVLEMKEKADKLHAQNPGKYPKRDLYVLNVRGFRYDLTPALELTPEDFKGWADHPEYLERLQAIESGSGSRDWKDEELKKLASDPIATASINPRFENAIILIDEAYEHGIFPKRAPSAKLPRHVERMAKHRHFGLDFVCVSQSPDKQCDGFLTDLIEWHVHVQRKFGTGWTVLRQFDKFNANAEKAPPTMNKRTRLPKKIFGLYESTVLDTTDKRIPWYFYAMGVMAIGVPLLGWYVFSTVGAKLSGKEPNAVVEAQRAADANGVRSTKVATAAAAPSNRTKDYLAWMRPRVEGQPWTAEAYDSLTIPTQPPRVFCMSSGYERRGIWTSETCTCLTEQGTKYRMEHLQCAVIAQEGMYEPFLVQIDGNMHGNTGQQQFQELTQENVIGGHAPYGTAAAYGGMGVGVSAANGNASSSRR